MISKQDLLDRAVEWRLRPDSPYSLEALTGQLRELTTHVSELSGLTFPPELIEVKPRRNQQGQPTFEGKVGYRGPLAYPGSPKIRFDFTQHEAIVEPAEKRPVFHPYPDDLPESTAVRAYSFAELLAEKTRALLERSRPRDLYDVVHLLENAADEFNLQHVRSVFATKCSSKGLQMPSSSRLAALVTADQELRSEWHNMLAHQLPALPDLDPLLLRLPVVLAWLDVETHVQPTKRPGLAVPSGEARIGSAGIRYWGSALPVEAIRFAGTNRLLIEFVYHGVHRVVEPYSVRQAQTGNVLLYGWELASGQVKAFKLAEMENLHTTATSFSPRYQIDLAATGPVWIRPTSQAVRSVDGRSALAGPTYIFQCSYCGKQFSHKTNDSTLRKHKQPGGWDCYGRRGYLVDTRY